MAVFFCDRVLIHVRWIDTQVEVTSKFLDQIPDKEKLEARLTQATDYPRVIIPNQNYRQGTQFISWHVVSVVLCTFLEKGWTLVLVFESWSPGSRCHLPVEGVETS